MATVELFGLPGSGKTTVAAIASSGEDDNPGRSHPLVASMRHPTVAVQCLAVYAHAGRRFRSEVSRALGQHALQRADPDLLLQQGIATEVWRQLFLDPDQANRSWWRPLLRYASDTVAVLPIDPGTARARIERKSTRGRINSILLAEPPDGPRWTHAVEMLRLVQGVLACTRGHRVVVLAPGPPEQMAAHVIALRDP